MNKQRIQSSINLPVWMDTAIRELADKHKRPLNREIEFLVEEALKNLAILPVPIYEHTETSHVMREAESA